MKIHLPLLGLAALVAVTSAAEARDRWQYLRFQPWQDRTIYYDDESDDDAAYYDEDDDEDVVVLNRRQRAAIEQDLWWMEDDARQILESRKRPHKQAAPIVKKKPAAKKQVTKTVPVTKPKLKVAAKAAPVVAVAAKSQTVAATKTSKPVSAKLQTASLSKIEPTPKPTGKTIGCTAGAAIVTGYGFGTVTPKACTGTTYAYNAQRAGKSYLIQLTAATGEITDVKKLN